jgi:hypothetical protein
MSPKQNKPADTLRSIVSGANGIVTESGQDLFSQGFIDKSEKWLSDNTNLNPMTKWQEWSREIGSSWSHTASNSPYFHDTLDGLHPEGASVSQKERTEAIKSDIEKLETDDSRESYFRDNWRKFPPYVHKELEEYFFDLRNKSDRKAIDRTRVFQIISVGNLLDDKKLTLSPQVGLESHVQDFLRAYDMGFTDEISTDENGRISVPVGAKETPVFILEDPNVSVEERLISLIDLSPMVRKRLRPLLDDSRDEVKQSELLALKALYNRIHTQKIPMEFKMNIAIDYALTQDNPGEVIFNAIDRIVMAEAMGGMLREPWELPRLYMSLVDEVTDRFKRRMKDG